jgi:hypothetical protein
VRILHSSAAVVFFSLFLSARLLAEDPSAVGGAPRLTAEHAEALVREISASVEKLRGLKFKAPVTMQVISGAEARQSWKSRISPWAEAEARHTQNAYVQLGLVPPGTDLLTSYLDLAEKDVAGYYEHGTRTFYVLDHVSEQDVRGTMAHELTHALEDQHYDFGAIAQRAEGDGDRATALSAVIEGSATAVMLAFLSREEGRKEAGRMLEKGEERRAATLRIAPTFTQRSLILPYVLGFTFLLRGAPWEWSLGDGVVIADLHQAYLDPPQSTRQILHPDQYWVGGAQARQRLAVPDLSATLGPGWTKATEGSIGELGLAVLTGARESIEMPWAFLPSRWTNDAAIGTVGDVYQHYVEGDRKATLLMTRWESELDAAEFDRALTHKGKRFYRYGVSLLVLAGDVADKADALALAAFQGAAYTVPTQRAGR